MDIQQPSSSYVPTGSSYLTQSLLSSMEDKKPTQYDSVKARYFQSLGMNRPPPVLSASVPTHSYMSSVTPITPTAITSNQIRSRTKTAPSPKSDSFEEDSTMRSRTLSIPIPLSGLTASNPTPNISTSLGTYLTNTSFDDEDEDDSRADLQSLNVSRNSIKNDQEDDIFGSSLSENLGFEDDRESDRVLDSPSKFVPPHLMMASSKKGFNVGTAHSLAVWEKGRRKLAE